MEYLNLLGYQPQKINEEGHWYLSPLGDKKEPSFKVNKVTNSWYNQGLEKGGKTIDFVKQYFSCGLREVLQKNSFFHQQNRVEKTFERQSFHRHRNVVLNEGNATETAVKKIAAKRPITELNLCPI